MISFEYWCDACGHEEDTESMTSFICDCGGNMRVKQIGYASVFHPFHSGTLGGYIRTQKEEEKAMKSKGVAYQSDYRKSVQDAKHVKKHKEEIIQATYAKEGLKYKPGSNTRLDEKRMEFVKANS